jgi:hypothetical protein
MTPPDAPHVPQLASNEYWIDADSAQQWWDEDIFEVVSPLDSENATLVELSEEQESLIEWLVTHHVQHIRLEDVGGCSFCFGYIFGHSAI